MRPFARTGRSISLSDDPDFVLVSELERFGRAAAEYLAAGDQLSEDTKSRVSELWDPACPSDDEIFSGRVPSIPHYGHPIDPEQINASLRAAAQVAGSIELLVGEVAGEKRPPRSPVNSSAVTPII